LAGFETSTFGRFSDVDRGGATVHVPKGTVPSITNTGDEPLTILEATSPPGFQEIFREMHRAGEPTLEDIVQMGARHDINMQPGGDT
jgi:oxalate decarboxylase/phosphoglucose isomerase-like protein (cupin superfamily)